MTIIEFPSIHRSTTEPAGQAPIWSAPARFDTHTVADLAEWVDANAALGATLEADLSACVFVDLYAIEALAAATRQAAEAGAEFVVGTQSLAARLTFELLDGRADVLALAA